MSSCVLLSGLGIAFQVWRFSWNAWRPKGNNWTRTRRGGSTLHKSINVKMFHEFGGWDKKMWQSQGRMHNWVKKTLLFSLQKLEFSQFVKQSFTHCTCTQKEIVRTNWVEPCGLLFSFQLRDDAGPLETPTKDHILAFSSWSKLHWERSRELKWWLHVHNLVR